MVFNKPCGLAVHSGTKIKNNLIDLFKISSSFKNEYLELAHRIDKETSGCIIFAKNKVFLRKFQLLLRFSLVKREYHALVKDHFNNFLKTRFYDNILNNYNAKIIVKYRETENIYDIIEKYSRYSLIKIFPLSGKMHQIRIHLAYIGNPIVGDKRYGSKKINEEIKKLNFSRMFLHLKLMKFKCPVERKEYVIDSLYDKNIDILIKKLEEKRSV